MREPFKTWLENLFNEEIRSTEGAISNERIWANGAPDDNSTGLHLANIEDLEEYIEILRETKETLLEEELEVDKSKNI